MIALVSPAQAQTFNDAINRALFGPPTGPINPSKGPSCQNSTGNLLIRICAAAGQPGSSSGSTTALSNEISPIDERKVQRLIGPLNVFISGEYERFDKNVTKFEPGYQTNSGRAFMGADYSFNERFLVGGLLKYARDSGNFDSVPIVSGSNIIVPGGHFHTDSYGPLLYANFVPAPKFFISTAAGYTRYDYFINRVASVTGIDGIIGPTDGNTDGNEFKVGVNGGYDFNFNSITIGPRFGLNYKYNEIDGYRERGSTGLELIYKNQYENSLTTVLGAYGSVAISTGFGVVLPQTSLEYVHEFLDPQRKIGVSFVDDLNRVPFRFQNDPPDRNYFKLGAGIVLVLPHGFSPFVNYRALVGYQNQSSHIATAGVRIEF